MAIPLSLSLTLPLPRDTNFPNIICHLLLFLSHEVEVLFYRQFQLSVESDEAGPEQEQIETVSVKNG